MIIIDVICLSKVWPPLAPLLVQNHAGLIIATSALNFSLIVKLRSFPFPLPLSVRHLSNIPIVLFYRFVSLNHPPDFTKVLWLQLFSPATCSFNTRWDRVKEPAVLCSWRNHLLFTQQMSWSQTWWKMSRELIRTPFVWKSMGRKSENGSFRGKEKKHLSQCFLLSALSFFFYPLIFSSISTCLNFLPVRFT